MREHFHPVMSCNLRTVLFQGKMTGFQDEMIHVYNKNEGAIHDSDYFQKLEHRNNVILMGDSLGDLHMADGAVGVQNKLKIGFLNVKVSHTMDYQ